ncbi:hypothetical protein [Type-D symbiont of Plautia stali]|uniref:hypothetical protein n=1 Tax=Type-D symbiont of Plautia stali TaxID=1560356 RepID=UPI001428A596|nr:hypothetical protein [Type-D symbiont of Plautia stali]
MITFLLFLRCGCQATGMVGGNHCAGEAIILSWNTRTDILSIFGLAGTIIFCCYRIVCAQITLRAFAGPAVITICDVVRNFKSVGKIWQDRLKSWVQMPISINTVLQTIPFCCLANSEAALLTGDIGALDTVRDFFCSGLD